MFERVLRTVNAANDCLITRCGDHRCKYARYKDDHSPLDESCSCYCCENSSSAYMHHLHRSKEILGARLNTVHNLHY